MTVVMNPIFWGGAATAAAGVALAGWAMAGDWVGQRRRGRKRRCPKCFYEMEGISGLRCPECGREAKSERRLFKARRRWRWVAVALLIIAVGTGGGLYPTLQKVNWVAQLPAAVLVRLVDDPYQPPPAQTVFSRWMTGVPATPASTQPTLHDRIVSEIWERYAHGTLPLSARRVLLKKIYGSHSPVTFVVRARWPSAVPMRVAMHVEAGPVFREAFATPVFAGSKELRCCTEEAGWGYRANDKPDEDPLPIGNPPEGDSGFDVLVRIEEGGQEVWSGLSRVRTAVGGAVDSVIQPVSSPEANEIVRDTFERYARQPAGGKWVTVKCPPRIKEWLSLLGGVCVALRVEVCKDGKVIAESRVAWSANAQRYDFSPWSSIYGWNDDKDVAWLPLTGDNAALAGADFSQPGWTLRVRSDPELALSDPTVTRYWSGEFVVPLVREP